MKKIIAALMICLIMVACSTSQAADSLENTVAFKEVLELDIGEVCGVSLFPYLQVQKKDNIEAIRKFASELLAFELVALEELPTPQNPGGGVYIEFYDREGKRINGVFVQDGRLERNYLPIMSRTPLFTHVVKEQAAFTDWLNGYIALWKAEDDSFQGYRIGNSDIVIPSAEKSASVLGELGLFKGTPDGYQLELPVTRAEAVTMVLRMCGEEETAQKAADSPVFIDVAPSHWAYANIGYAVQKGYLSGISDNLFRPQDGISGREFTGMFLKALGYEGITPDNAYTEGVKHALLANNYAKLAVSTPEYQLLRNDMVNICYLSLLVKTADGRLLKDVLTEKGLINEQGLNRLILDVNPSPPGSRGFAWNLNSLMPQDENYVLSPFSIKMALAMAAMGAEGATRDEILKVLEIKDLQQYSQLAGQVIKEYGENQDVEINIANSIWLNTDYYPGVDFSNSFQEQVATYFDAYSEKVNNRNAAEKINSWVNDKTNGLIKELVSDNDFLACLVNAIYFKGEWEERFSASETRKDEFTDRNNKKSEIDFMNMTGLFNYYEDPYVRMLELPYKDKKTAMYIALPGSRELDLMKSIEKMTKRRVQVSLPKFKTEFDITLCDSLSRLGIQTAFDEYKADFKKMFSEMPENAFISDVIHKAFITVDEAGTEAAAATGIKMQLTSVQVDEPVLFKADRPFTYFIRDNVNGEILFLGEYAYAE